ESNPLDRYERFQVILIFLLSCSPDATGVGASAARERRERKPGIVRAAGTAPAFPFAALARCAHSNTGYAAGISRSASCPTASLPASWSARKWSKASKIGGCSVML